ncbi:MAG TPA: ABC transporter permease subunit [Microvirga sp.]|jgi:polar amino acid transport system permease protein|nr:ABC transporter permease subunit [Microvirga sp.]
MNWSLLAYGPGWGDELLNGLALTLSMAVLAYGIGTAFGLAAALGELSRVKPVAALLSGYAAVLRSVPELLVIFFLYFGGSFLLGAMLSPLGFDGFVEVDGFWAAVLALALVQGAYASEVFRGAFVAVPTGLREAAQALGLRPAAVFRLVVLPVALRYAFPGLSNLWMVVVKNTPLVSVVGLNDFIRAAGVAGQNSKAYFLFYGSVIAVYLVISGVSMIMQARVERRLWRGSPPLGQPT